MSAYSEWKAGHITDEQYRASYAREQWEQNHPEEALPFYTDDADDPHWRCENCGHCKEYKVFKRIIKEHPRYFYESKESLHKQEDKTCYTLWVAKERTEWESVWLCEVDKTEHFDDDYCEEFIEINGD